MSLKKEQPMPKGEKDTRAHLFSYHGLDKRLNPEDVHRRDHEKYDEKLGHYHREGK